MAVDNKLEPEGFSSKLEQEKQISESQESNSDLEIRPEQEISKESEPIQESEDSIVQPTATPAKQQQEEAITPEEEEEIEEVEHILEEDLGDIYKEMDPKTKSDFERQGEITAKTIVSLLHKVRIRTRLIMKVISRWLNIIPGVNRNFVEQESKIKTDQIVDMHEHEHGDKKH